MNNVTEKTHGLVQRWINARKSVERAKAVQNAAESEFEIAQNDLGKWLMPEGLVPDGETFHIWFGSGILKATRRGEDYQVGWRKEPDGKDRLEFGC